jgi:hypothetical protein
MTVPAMQGIVGWGPQGAKGTYASTFYRMRALDVDLGLTEESTVSPPEVGGDLYPAGAYKLGAFVGGGFGLQPRLDDVIGWLLYGVLGDVATTPDTPESGMYSHEFKPAASSLYLPWMSFRKMIPGATGIADDYGELMLDCKIAAMRFTIPQAGVLTARVDVQGREPAGGDDPAGWSWGNAMEGFASIPISMKGGLTIPEYSASEQPATGCTITLANNLSTPRQERIIGSYFPDDLVPMRRTAELTWVYKWADPALYKKIKLNGGVGTGEDWAQRIGWSPIVFTSDFHLEVESPGDVPGMSYPWKLIFDGTEVAWRSDGTPRLAGGDILSLNFVGSCLAPNSGDFFKITLQNEASGYVWP